MLNARVATIVVVAGLAAIQPLLWAQKNESTFEVVSVKRNMTESTGMGLYPSPGRFFAKNYTLRALIQDIYKVKDYQVLGGPKWFDSERYDILAKADGTPDWQRMRLMIEAMLVDRFHLKFRRELRQMPIYLLVTSKRPPRIQETKEVVGDSGSLRIQGSKIVGHKVSMSRLADALGGQLNRPVHDGTGLQAKYDFTLEWSADETDVTAPSVFAAVQEQLGLRLVGDMGPIEVLVVEQAERPTEN